MQSVDAVRLALSTEWTSSNAVLGLGEFGIEQDGGAIKIGDGTTPWNSIPYHITPFQKINSLDSGVTAYTLLLIDAGRIIQTNTASANTITIPPNSSVAFRVGTEISFYQSGAGQPTITAGVGVTLRSPDGLKISAQYKGAVALKVATDEWVISGSLTA